MAYLKLARSSDGNAQHVTGLVSSATNAINAAGNLQGFYYTTNVGSFEFQAIIPIQTAMILPAGKYTATAIFSSLSTAATMIVNRVTCSVSN